VTCSFATQQQTHTSFLTRRRRILCQNSLSTRNKCIYNRHFGASFVSDLWLLSVVRLVLFLVVKKETRAKRGTKTSNPIRDFMIRLFRSTSKLIVRQLQQHLDRLHAHLFRGQTVLSLLENQVATAIENQAVDGFSLSPDQRKTGRKAKAVFDVAFSSRLVVL
jgi:hypothetical protein